MYLKSLYNLVFEIQLIDPNFNIKVPCKKQYYGFPILLAAEPFFEIVSIKNEREFRQDLY